SKIINAQLNAVIAEPFEHDAYDLNILHDSGLGYFKLQHSRIHPGYIESLDHLFQEIGVHELLGREIDCNRQRQVCRELLMPASHLGARFTENPLADWRDVPGILSHWNEIAWPDEASLGMLPADQGLKPTQAATLQRNNRLIFNEELAPINCPAHVGLHVQKIQRVGVQTFVEQGVPGLTFGFGV